MIQIKILENDLNYQNRDNIIDKRYFLMCKSCFWCLSCLTEADERFTNCPLCGINNLEWLPILHSESYKLEIDQVRGIALEFGPNLDITESSLTKLAPVA